MKIYPSDHNQGATDSFQLGLVKDPFYKEEAKPDEEKIEKVPHMITPEELVHSILHPQIDPLVGQIVFRLLQKTRPSRAFWAKDFNDDEFQL